MRGNSMALLYQRRPDALSLKGGLHRQRRQHEDDRLADMRLRKQNMAGQHAVYFGNQR